MLPSGLVAKSLLETQAGRDLYLKRVFELRTNVFLVGAITNRMAQQAARLRPVLLKQGVGEYARFESSLNMLRSRIIARGHDVDQQLKSVKNFARMKLNESVALTNWVPRTQFGEVVADKSDAPAALHLKVSNETSFGAWTALTWLEEGRYVLEGRVRTRNVRGAVRNEEGGAGFRVWSDRKETRGASWGWFPYSNLNDSQLGGLISPMTNSVNQRLTGTADWATIRHEFELRQPLADLQIQCVLQGNAGEAWFELSSLKIRRLSFNVSKVSSTVRGE